VGDNHRVRTFRGAWSLAGLAAGAAGLGTSYFVAMAMTLKESPVVAVADLVIRLTPGWLAHYLIEQVGRNDKPLLLVGIFVVLALVFAWAGRLARRSWWAPVIVYAVLTVLGVVAVSQQRGASNVDLVPVAVGFVTWLVALSLLTEPLRRLDLVVHHVPTPHEVDVLEPVPPGDHTRRGFLIRTGIFAAGAAALSAAGRVVGRGRRHVEESPRVPAAARNGVEGITPWQTSNAHFYRIDTAIVVPAIEPKDWTLRIHGLVDRELLLTYSDLLKRRFTEGWITLNCVSNPVGGNLIGNAWWSGVRLADLLDQAGPLPGADAVLQTSDDGWTCGTPLSVLTDDRNAMLAVAMNGSPLPLEHGFPVRTLVPGLYGYVSACKWVVDMEVTSFDKISAYWTERGWAELGPVKMSSRIDVPRRDDEIGAGETRVGGVAWSQHTGISAVEVSLDGGAWQSAELGNAETVDSWAQWSTKLTVERGDHTLRVRATDDDGLVQTGAVADVLPDGATGWHEVHFSAV
jgi:DMSO/TMAO reductase YedYZ molybdopterin-dependent catalytic subunit